jgi:hypothetical protein
MSSAAIEFIDSLPWKEVTHAYGNAGDAPSELRRLLSDDEDERMDAICGFLLSSVFHQYSIYSATPYAMISVIRILESGEINELESGMGNSMASELLHFVRICAERGQVSIEGRPDPFAPTIEEAALSGRQLYEMMAKDSCPKVRDEATALLGMVGGNQRAEQAAPSNGG